MKKGISIALRVVLWSLLGIFALVVIVILLVQVPAVQDFGRRKAVTWLQEKLGTDVAIGHLRLGLPNTLLLEDVYFEDQQGDTLLAAGELFVHISPFRLLRNEVRIDQVRVEKFSSNLRLAADSSFNFDFIIDAFVTEPEEPAPPDSSAALAISLGEFDLNDIRLTYRDETNASSAAVSWDRFHAGIRESDIDRLRFDVRETSITGLYLAYTDPSAGMETENRLGRLDLSSLMFDLTSQEIALGTVRLDSTLAAFAFLAQTPGTPAPADPAAPRPAGGTPDSTTRDPGWKVAVEELLISHTGFRFDDHNAPPQPSGMDYMHLDVSDLDLDLRALSYSPEAISGDLKSASLREKSGLDVKTFRTAFEYNATGASLNGLLLETGGSVLREQIRIGYPSLEQATEDLSLLSIEASLPGCRISYADLLLVAPFMAEYEPFRSTRDGMIGIDGRAHGTVGDLVIEHLEATTLDQTRLVAKAHLKGLPDMEKAWFDVELAELSSGNRDLVRLAGRDMIPSSVRLPASFSLEGAFTGSMDQFSGQAFLRSSYGNVAAEGSMAPGQGEGHEKYSARIRTSGFHLGRLLKQEDTLGRISFRAAVEGSGTTAETADARVKGELEELEYNGYTYRGLALAGTIRDEQVTAQAAMRDPNIRFVLDGSANLSGAYPAAGMRLQLDTLNLRALNLYEKELTLGMELTADLPTADPDHLNGRIAVNDLALQLDSGHYRIDTILLQATATDTLKTIDLRSEFMRATAAGNFTTSGLAPAIMAHINRYFATGDTLATPATGSTAATGAMTATGVRPATGARPATGSATATNAAHAVAPADTNRAAADSSVQQLTLTARIFHPPVLHELLPELTRMDTICIDAHFDNRAQVMQASAVAPAIRYGSNEIDSVVLAINTGDTSIDYHLLLQRFYNPAVQVIHTSLEGEAAGNRLGIHLVTRDNELKERYRIGGVLSADSGAYGFRFLPEELLFDYQAWNVQDDNLFYYSDSGFYARNIHLSNGGQSLALNSEEYRPAAPLEVSFDDFELSTLTRIAQQDSLAVGGQLNGNAVISNLDSSMVFVSDLLVNNFSFRRDTVGNIGIKVNNEEENTYTADISVKSDKNRVNLAGYYYPKPVEGNNFDLALDILHLDMGTVEAFSFGQLAGASGSIKGSFNITGSAEKPSVLGGLVFQKAAFTPTMINSPLFLEDETIALTDEGIGFSNFTVLDSMKNAAVLNGMIYTTDFTDYRFDLRLTTNNFRAINTLPDANALYYGQLYLDSDVRIEGTIDNPDVNAYLRVNEKTNLTMTLPTSEPGVQEREGVVEFVDMDAPADTLQSDTLRAATDITGLDLSADLEVDEEAQFTVIVDPVNGDNLQVKGNAALSIGVDPNGTINLTGRYEIAEGAYELSFNLIKRRFEISEGSYITWVGDPYSADVDITAVYLAETAPLELVQDQLTSMSQSEKNTFKQKLPFQVFLHMEGELMKPAISFNIDLPEKERDAHGGLVYARLQQLQLQESDLNKQVFALLVLNRFVAENPLESMGGSSVSSIARQSVSKLLSAQLNRLAGDLIAGVDLNFDLESTEDYSTGQKVDRTDLNVGLSKSLLNDRIRVNVGSSFGLEGQETRGKASTIAGDVSVDYQLSKDGRYLLRAYRQNEYEGVIEGQIIETGLSFIISLDYDEFRELFRK